MRAATSSFHKADNRGFPLSEITAWEKPVHLSINRSSIPTNPVIVSCGSYAKSPRGEVDRPWLESHGLHIELLAWPDEVKKEGLQRGLGGGAYFVQTASLNHGFTPLTTK